VLNEAVTRVYVPGYDDRRFTSGPDCCNLGTDASRLTADGGTDQRVNIAAQAPVFEPVCPSLS
jgi:hypothetical protein